MGGPDNKNPEVDHAKFEEFQKLFRDLGKKFDTLNKNMEELNDLLDDHGQAVADNTEMVDMLRKAVLDTQKNPFSMVGNIGNALKDIRNPRRDDPRDDEEYEDE